MNNIFALTDIEYVIVLSFFCISLIKSIKSKKENTYKICAIHPSTSLVLKAFCCIIIICHHYALRTTGGLMDKILDIGGGTYSLVIFLLLSTYGITRSEQKYGTTIVLYARKRLWKVFQPYLVITIFSIVLYWIIGANVTEEQLLDARVNPTFGLLGSHQATPTDMLGYVLGTKSLDRAMWFVGVTLYSYTAFLLSKLLLPSKSLMEKRGVILLSYTVLILFFAAFTYWKQFPAHYYRNLWALVLGLMIALYEKEILTFNILKKALLYLIVNLAIATWLRLTSSGDWMYIVFANLGMTSIIALNNFFKHFSLIKGGTPIIWLASVSYLIYLVQGKILAIQWWYMGYCSVLLAIIITIIVAGVFSKLLKMNKL